MINDNEVDIVLNAFVEQQDGPDDVAEKIQAAISAATDPEVVELLRRSRDSIPALSPIEFARYREKPLA